MSGTHDTLVAVSAIITALTPILVTFLHFLTRAILRGQVDEIHVAVNGEQASLLERIRELQQEIDLLKGMIERSSVRRREGDVS